MYIYLYIDVAMTILALVELLKIALIIIEKGLTDTLVTC